VWVEPVRSLRNEGCRGPIGERPYRAVPLL